MVPDGPETQFIFEAYDDLASCRNQAGSIPWTAARLYAEDHGLDREAFRLLWLIIKAMDAAERQWVADQGSKGETGA